MNKRLLIGLGVVLAVVILFIILLSVNKIGSSAGVSGRGGRALLDRAKNFEANAELLNAKNAYQKLITDFPNSTEVMDWQRKIEELNIKLFFSPVVTEGSVIYEIKPGDSFHKIAREFNTTPELIKRSNHFTSDLISPGSKIKVWVAPFSILVDKSQNTLILKTNEEIIKTYVVSTGKDNSSPVGTFKIVNKMLNPTWFKSGAVVPAGSPENILGTRWLGLDVVGYGIHGTTDPQSLGKQVTLGCVRMLNAEVEELYDIVPVGTEVTIVD